MHSTDILVCVVNSIHSHYGPCDRDGGHNCGNATTLVSNSDEGVDHVIGTSDPVKRSMWKSVFILKEINFEKSWGNGYHHNLYRYQWHINFT